MTRKLTPCIVSLALLTTAVAACSDAPAAYKIGISQCSEDIWREKQNDELRMAAYLHDNVELCFAAAYDSDERQVQQIDSLVATGIDLLIVAPNQVATISPAIDRAYDQGIPVIVFERKTSSKKFTASMSADNYEMGRMMGMYIAGQLKGTGTVLEVMGLKGSSPAIERHKGFADALSEYPSISLVATLQGDWTEQSAFDATQRWLKESGQNGLRGRGIDYVFGQNDRMAMGARRAFETFDTRLSTRYCGIDGLPGANGGIQLVRDSLLDASYIYPTHGDKLLQLAIDILENNDYEKESKLMSALVTRDNASVLLMQAEEIARQSGYLDQLHQRADGYLAQLDTQRAITFLALGVMLLLVMVFVLLFLYQKGKISLRRQRVVSTLWNLDDGHNQQMNSQPLSQEPLPHPVSKEPHPHPVSKEPLPQPLSKGREEYIPSSAEQAAELTTPLSPWRGAGGEALERGAGGEALGGTSLFITRFKEVVESQLSNSELSIEDLAAQMNLSRVQLYRKVKSITGSSPVELLRTARLNRGYQLLLTTEKNISEVAYAVGFTAPSYFAKCFKEEFGMSPTDVKK